MAHLRRNSILLLRYTKLILYKLLCVILFYFFFHKQHVWPISMKVFSILKDFISITLSSTISRETGRMFQNNEFFHFLQKISQTNFNWTFFVLIRRFIATSLNGDKIGCVSKMFISALIRFLFTLHKKRFNVFSLRGKYLWGNPRLSSSI